MFYFWKMQATGNDFIVIDYIDEKFEYSLKLLSKFMCDRHYGVGADGLIIVEKSDFADFKMRIFNSDGSEAEMCGNGIRCFAKYIYEKKLIQKEKLKIETLAGIKEVEIFVEGKTVMSVKVDMGMPIFEFEKIPVICENYIERESINNDITYANFNRGFVNKQKVKGIKIEDKIYYPISIGNPHVVCFVENVDEINIEEFGRKIENYKYFPNKTNIEFVQIISDKKIKVRVWERGVGETLSCGTGACAAAIISNLVKFTNSDLIVDLKGGIFKINYENTINLIGEVENVFEGKICFQR